MFTGKFIIGLAAEVSIGCLFKTLALSQSTRMFFWKNNNRNLKHWKKLNTEENISHCAKVVVLKKIQMFLKSVLCVNFFKPLGSTCEGLRFP